MSGCVAIKCTKKALLGSWLCGKHYEVLDSILRMLMTRVIADTLENRYQYAIKEAVILSLARREWGAALGKMSTAVQNEFHIHLEKVRKA